MYLGWVEAFQSRFYLNFIKDDRFIRYILGGLSNTLLITTCAVVIGIALGVLIALVRVTHDKAAPAMRPGLARSLLLVADAFCRVFITVIRGVPVVVQLMIWFFAVFPALFPNATAVTVAIIAFGINSAAYVAEIMRGGIMSVDGGQMEAGRSLGLNYIQTMRFITLPQAFKNALPTLCNEFIMLLKETAVAGYIAVMDLTKGAYIILGRSFDSIFPLTMAALIYLVIVMFLSWLFGKLERRLRESDKR